LTIIRNIKTVLSKAMPFGYLKEREYPELRRKVRNIKVLQMVTY